jgi:hypothetical protein
MGTGHYYIDEMRGSFKKLGSKSGFCGHETQNLFTKTNCLNLNNHTSRSAEKGNMK